MLILFFKPDKRIIYMPIGHIEVSMHSIMVFKLVYLFIFFKR